MTSPQEAALMEKSQSLLLQFLSTELELGNTFAQMCREEIKTSPAHSRRLREHAERAVETIRQFSQRLSDVGLRIRIEDKAREIEKTLAGPREAFR